MVVCTQLNHVTVAVVVPVSNITPVYAINNGLGVVTSIVVSHIAFFLTFVGDVIAITGEHIYPLSTIVHPYVPIMLARAQDPLQYLAPIFVVTPVLYPVRCAHHINDAS